MSEADRIEEGQLADHHEIKFYFQSAKTGLFI